MDRTFRFSFQRRVRTLLPILIAEALLLIFLFWRGARGWTTALLCAFAALLFLRIASHLLGVQRPLVITEKEIRRGRFSVEFARTQAVIVRTLAHGEELQPTEVVVVGPGSQRPIAVGFDVSLEGFERAVKAILLVVPEEKVRVYAPGQPDVQDARREQVLDKLRPNAADRALAELGPPALGRPPQK